MFSIQRIYCFCLCSLLFFIVEWQIIRWAGAAQGMEGEALRMEIIESGEMKEYIENHNGIFAEGEHGINEWFAEGIVAMEEIQGTNQ